MPNDHADEPVTLAERFELETFIAGIVGDLNALREGKITVRDARARAVLATQVLRGIHYVVTAQKYLDARAKQLPNPGDQQ